MTRLRHNAPSGARYIYGRHPVNEALRACPGEVQGLFVASGRADRLGDLISKARAHGIPVASVTRRALEDMVGEVTHQGVVATVASFAYVEVEDLLAVAKARNEPPLLLALDQIQDPHNLGALIRSALALGAHGVILPKDNSCEVTPVAVKASAGATAHLGVAKVVNLRRALDELKDAGLWVIGALAAATTPVAKADFTSPSVIVVGSEGKGLRRLVAETCDVRVAIPMTSALGSLNASVAGAILLYEANRQRRR